MWSADPQLDELTDQALTRLANELGQAAPALAAQVTGWLRQLAQAEQPAAYFKNPIGFPLLRLPWWLEKTLHPPKLAFQADIVYSSVNGYYYVRLLDNVMDGHATVERSLLPAAGFFHTQFQMVYQGYFDPAHPFWNFFKQVWFQSAEVTFRDAGLQEVSLDQFRALASQKVCAGKIPLAAVCHYYERLDRLDAWLKFIEAFGAWHQMWNDLFDWNKDLKYGACTYFLSEAERQRRAGESIAAWVVRDGFEWGSATLQTWMANLKRLAGPLDSPDLLAYLAGREHRLWQQKAALADSLDHLTQLAAVMPQSN
jgi:hypothetical protein